jgi:hypothetical protein
MLRQISEWILAIPHGVPILFGADAPNAALIRAMVALLLIVLVVYLIAMRPFRFAISRCASWARKRILRSP